MVDEVRRGEGCWASFPDGVAVVIGGSGGIGRVICEGFAEAGCDVALTYCSNAEAAEQAAAVVRRHGCKATIHQLSTEGVAAVIDFFDTVIAGHGRIHTVVNAAGSDIPMRFIGQLEAEEWRRVMDSDVHGFFNLIQASLPHLRERGGSYVQLSSVGLQRWPARDVLSVAPKAAIDALMTGIAREEGRSGVRANSVALGVVNAGLYLRLKGKVFDEAYEEAAIRNTALKRLGSAQEVADVVVFLASDRARYVTGQTITLDGGYSL